MQSFLTQGVEHQTEDGTTICCAVLFDLSLYFQLVSLLIWSTFIKWKVSMVDWFPTPFLVVLFYTFSLPLMNFDMYVEL
jgi:hypothetical protein